MEITVLQPEGTASREGGGAFIRQLSAALMRAGHSVTDSPAPGRLLVVDGMAVPAMPDALVADAVALVHHPTALAAPGEQEAIRAIERDRLPRMRRVVATSRAVGERLVTEFGVPRERMRVVEPGVAAHRRAAGSGGPGCAILSVGALVPRKGHATLLRALARLQDLDWSLTIVGDDRRDPATAAALRDQAAAIAGRVRFAGSLEDAALDAAWHEADLFALATEWEGQSATVAEALRRGVPVAVTAGGAAADMVTPENGVVCHPGDADGLSKAMRRLIFDTGLRDDMAAAAWRSGQALPGWDQQAAAFLEGLS